jgi:peptidyl-prolyl cis-trans isomerase C
MSSPFPRRALGVTLLLAVSGTLLAAEEPAVLATVNGKNVDQTAFDNYAERRSEQQPAAPQTMLQELINLELLVQDAEARKLDQDPDYAVEMEMTRRSLLAQLAVRSHIEAHPVTDEQMREVYDREVGKASGEELKARHILLKSSEEALEVIKALDAGGDFAALAKEHSTGPSGPQGGDLGWFSTDQMVPEFSTAAAALETGKYTAEPVQTQFGWHVIMLEEKRPLQPPPFEELKEQIQTMLQGQQVRSYLNGLREAAKIEVK